MGLKSYWLQANGIVTLGLLIAAAAAVLVAFAKWRGLRQANREADEFEDRFWSGGSLDGLFEAVGTNPAHPMVSVFVAGMAEWRRSVQAAGADIRRAAVLERVDRSITVATHREIDQLQRWMAFLATFGIAAPLAGLCGTVCSLAASGPNLATSVAEALPATAVSLSVAVPAILAHRLIGASLTRFRCRLQTFGTELTIILSRQSEPTA